MTRIVLPSIALDQLGRLTESVEICDPSGKVVGYFRPAHTVIVPFTDEELDAFEQEPGGRPLAEILSDLERHA